MKRYFSPVAWLLKISPDGMVPDHGWVTWVSEKPCGDGPFEGARFIFSALWHAPDVVQLRVSVDHPLVDQPGLVADSLVRGYEVFDALYTHLVGLGRLDGPFLHPSSQAHVSWLAEHGISLPYDHPHWETPYLDEAEDVEPDPVLDSLRKQMPVRPRELEKVVLPIDAAKGERPYLDLAQDQPHDGYRLRFRSKVLPDGLVEGVLIAVDRAGNESELNRLKGSEEEISRFLRETARAMFRHGERWACDNA